MKANVELRLSHDGNQWIGEGDGFVVKGDTFEHLDDAVRRELIVTGEFSPGSQVKVFMGFDFDTLPTWLRQYHTHYFNRILVIDL